MSRFADAPRSRIPSTGSGRAGATSGAELAINLIKLGLLVVYFLNDSDSSVAGRTLGDVFPFHAIPRPIPRKAVTHMSAIAGFVFRCEYILLSCRFKFSGTGSTS